MNIEKFNRSLADLNGIETFRIIISKFPDIKIIVLSMHTDKARIIESIRVSARGYIIKNYI
jgi:DNA-binding NarL/FixJ family response regulator